MSKNIGSTSSNQEYDYLSKQVNIKPQSSYNNRNYNYLPQDFNQANKNNIGNADQPLPSLNQKIRNEQTNIRPTTSINTSKPFPGVSNSLNSSINSKANLNFNKFQTNNNNNNQQMDHSNLIKEKSNQSSIIPQNINEVEFTKTFEDEKYYIIVKVTEIDLSIVLENENTIFWKGSFPKEGIERLTKKVESNKDYSTFIKMLLTALANPSSPSVSLDLLDQKQIETLKSKQQVNSSTSNNLESSLLDQSHNINPIKNIKSNKYLILTFHNEFETRHHPLLLEYLNEPDANLFYNSIKRLKSNQKVISNSNFNSQDPSVRTIINFNEYESLKNENVELRNKIVLLENSRTPGAVDIEEVLAENSDLKEDIVKLKNETKQKIQNLTSDLEEFKRQSNQLEQNKSNTVSATYHKEKIDNMSKQMENLTKIISEEREKFKVLIDKKSKEIADIKSELINSKENEKKMKVRINQLEKDLDKANGRNNYMSKLNATPRSMKSNYSVKSVKSNASKNYSYASNFSYKSNSSNLRKGLMGNNNNNKNLKTFTTNKNKIPFSTKKLSTGAINTKSKYNSYSSTGLHSNSKNKYSKSPTKLNNYSKIASYKLGSTKSKQTLSLNSYGTYKSNISGNNNNNKFKASGSNTSLTNKYSIQMRNPSPSGINIGMKKVNNTKPSQGKSQITKEINTHSKHSNSNYNMTNKNNDITAIIEKPLLERKESALNKNSNTNNSELLRQKKEQLLQNNHKNSNVMITHKLQMQLNNLQMFLEKEKNNN